MNCEYPLFSFAIVSYNNYHYMKEALESVFNQDYPNIQLIISNDGSDDFDENDLINYLNQKKTSNIKQVIINNNERNLGTVKNIEYCRQQSEGEYIMYMAADDALYDGTVLTRFAEEFNRLGEKALCVCAKIAMCSNVLSEIMEYFPDEDGIHAIKTFDSQNLFSRMSHTFTIPTTGTCYRKDLYEKMGPYDAEYFIIEDAPFYIKMARNGIKFYWIDDFTAARHRDGGISHGNTAKLTEGYRKYRYDEIILYKKEILPYKSLIINTYDLKKMNEKWKYLERSYFETFIFPNMSFKDKLTYAGKHFPSMLKSLIKRIKTKVIEYAYDETIFLESRRIGAYSLGLYLLVYLRIFDFILGDKAEVAQMIFGWAALVGFSLAVLLCCLRIIYRVYLAMKYILFRK